MTRTRTLLFASMYGFLSLGFSACSDNDDVVAFSGTNVDPSYTTKGVETEVESTIIEVPITSSGKWFADVDSCEWLDVMDDGSPIHKGNGVIRLKVDDNRTGVGRKNKLYVVDMDNFKTIEIPVYQSNTYHGEPQSNGVADWFNNNSIGCAADYSYFMEPKANRSGDFEPTKVSKNNNIFNMAAIESRQKIRETDDPLYINSQIPIAKLDDQQLVNSIRKSDTLDVTIEMGCSFGFIEFQGKGQYSSKMDNKSDKVNYSICRDAPVLNSNLQVQNIVSAGSEDLYKYLVDDGVGHTLDSFMTVLKEMPESMAFTRKITINKMAAIKKPTLGGLFTKGFRDAYWNLFYFNFVKDVTCPDEAEQKKKFNTYLNALDKSYGPFFISGGQFGGSLNLCASVDKKDLNEDAQFLAEISANISSAFNLEGNVKFSSSGQQIYKKSTVKMLVYGGDAAKTANDVVKLLDSEDMTRTDSLAVILNRWADSFAKFDDKTNEPKKAAPILFKLTPIWTLFSTEPELEEIVENYFMEKYADKGIEKWTNIYEGNGPAQVEDLLHDLAK